MSGWDLIGEEMKDAVRTLARPRQRGQSQVLAYGTIWPGVILGGGVMQDDHGSEAEELDAFVSKPNPENDGEHCHYKRGESHSTCDIIEIMAFGKEKPVNERHWCTECGDQHTVIPAEDE